MEATCFSLLVDNKKWTPGGANSPVHAIKASQEKKVKVQDFSLVHPFQFSSSASVLLQLCTDRRWCGRHSSASSRSSPTEVKPHSCLMIRLLAVRSWAEETSATCSTGLLSWPDDRVSQQGRGARTITGNITTETESSKYLRCFSFCVRFNGQRRSAAPRLHQPIRRQRHLSRFRSSSMCRQQRHRLPIGTDQPGHADRTEFNWGLQVLLFRRRLRRPLLSEDEPPLPPPRCLRGSSWLRSVRTMPSMSWMRRECSSHVSSLLSLHGDGEDVWSWTFQQDLKMRSFQLKQWHVKLNWTQKNKSSSVMRPII